MNCGHYPARLKPCPDGTLQLFPKPIAVHLLYRTILVDHLPMAETQQVRRSVTLPTQVDQQILHIAIAGEVRYQPRE
jgi:hypothetical protein